MCGEPDAPGARMRRKGLVVRVGITRFSVDPEHEFMESCTESAQLNLHSSAMCGSHTGRAVKSLRAGRSASRFTELGSPLGHTGSSRPAEQASASSPGPERSQESAHSPG